QFKAAATARLDAFAAENGYDKGIGDAIAVTRDSGAFNPDFPVLQAAYDSIWMATIAIIPDVRSGAITVDQAVEQLPAPAWPETEATY
ncbi:MAG: hypothetical protein LBQ51_07210, partial [Desulfovibrio sp.]|nr:hypothetical protein [Desulfovibrio sp.]